MRVINTNIFTNILNLEIFTQIYPHIIKCHSKTLHISGVDVFLCVEILYTPKWTKNFDSLSDFCG
jgi:hypothetical protein